ncbi:hypothetical protein GW17_00043461 [Ensete ventricosum]|nr:hypothetical protein GW17_00043461 [Ensete ventricosum]
MGACATKPMAQGDAPLPLEQPPSPRGSEGENARKEEEMVAAAGRDTKQGTPDKNEQKSDGEISEPTETDKHVVSETAAPETVEVKEEEVMEHNEMDEAAEDGTEEQLVEIFESEEPEEAVAYVTPLKTSAPSLPTDSEGASVGDVEPTDSQVKASDQIAKVESIPKDGPADEGKKGDVFSALFNAYNNLLNKT